jgi:UDP-N-acetyl-D-mannosaminuronic acid dehydrogenase
MTHTSLSPLHPSSCNPHPSYDLCIVGGLGHVGLPLGLSLAQAGQRVVLYDINEAGAAAVSAGHMPFVESGADEVLADVLGRTLFVSTDRAVIGHSHFVVIVIGTPVDEHLNPRFSIFQKFFDTIIDLISDDQHIILRSTAFPGATTRIKDHLQARGKRTRVSFCPERIAQGQAMKELHSLPQIVASFDEEGLAEAAALFRLLTDDIVVLTPTEAELAKLFTNAWRYIQFAIANQFYQVACQQGLDFYRIHGAITHNYPRAASFPTAGFTAGPCLFKDTMQLAACSTNNFFLGHAAMLVNEGLPNFIVQKLKERGPLTDKVVGVLGMAFKADIDDRRESLAYKLKKVLETEARQVLCSDCYIEEAGFVPASELVATAEIVIVAAPHREYADLAFPGRTMVVDVWNFFGKGGAF